MKGYYFINTDIVNGKGHSIQISKTIESMVSSEMDIVLVCPKYKSSYNISNINKMYLLEKGFPIIFLPIPFNSPSKLSIVYVSIAATIFVIWKKIIKQASFIYFRSEYFLPLAQVATILRIPFFYEVHRTGLTERAQKRKEYLALKATGIIVLTEHLKKQFLKFNKHIHVAHDAVDVNQFPICNQQVARKELGMDSSALVGVYAGSVQYIKGIKTIITSAEKLPGVTFYIYGRIADKDLANGKIPPNLYFMGSYKLDKLSQILCASDFTILPDSKGPQSQSPMKLFEYMASGKLVVSSDLPNIREVLPENNLFFEPDNPESFCVVVEQYIKNKEYYTNVGKKNREKSYEYSWKERGKGIAKFIQNIFND